MGAFQRSMNAGFIPKAMRQSQEWNAAQMPTQGYMQQEGQAAASMQYPMAGDAQQMWCGAGQTASPDCLGILMNRSTQQVQQNAQMAPSMAQQAPMQYYPMPQTQPPLQMPSFMGQSSADVDQAQMMTQMQAPQMNMATMQLPPMAMADGEHTPAMSGASTPSQMMAFVNAQNPDELVAQLKAAAADCQFYED